MQEGQAKRKSFVRCELDRLEQSICGLQNSIKNLGERLSMVLKSTEPAPNETANKEASEGVDLSRIIERYVKEIHQCTYVIDDIITRCEL